MQGFEAAFTAATGKPVAEQSWTQGKGMTFRKFRFEKREMSCEANLQTIFPGLRG